MMLSDYKNPQSVKLTEVFPGLIGAESLSFIVSSSCAIVDKGCLPLKNAVGYIVPRGVLYLPFADKTARAILRPVWC
jgi:hypothetical protein